MRSDSSNIRDTYMFICVDDSRREFCVKATPKHLHLKSGAPIGALDPREGCMQTDVSTHVLKSVLGETCKKLNEHIAFYLYLELQTAPPAAQHWSLTDVYQDCVQRIRSRTRRYPWYGNH